MLVRAAPPVFAVVVIRTGVSLTTQAGGLFTELRLVVGQHIIVIWNKKGEQSIRRVTGTHQFEKKTFKLLLLEIWAHLGDKLFLSALS